MTLTPLGPNKVRLDPFPFDVNPVSYEIEPARRGPADPLFGGDLVADHDVAAVADAPAQGDGAQAEVELLPAEEQFGIVAACLFPRRPPDRVTGADIGDRVEAFTGTRQ